MIGTSEGENSEAVVRQVTEAMAALVVTRGTMLLKGSSRPRNNGGSANPIPIPQLPDRKERLADYDLEILMLDGCVWCSRNSFG